MLCSVPSLLLTILGSEASICKVLFLWCPFMKLAITIPAFNEHETLAAVIQSLPKRIEGIDEIGVFVINDGSSDDTVAIGEANGATVVSHKVNLGLAYAFATGLKTALAWGADVIVNTDADNQYDQKEIPALVQPILAGKADIVNTDRQVQSLPHMPAGKKYGNMIGTWVINKLIGQDIGDASSGFRAYAREAAANLHILSNHTYTHETLIQASMKKMVIVTIPCTFKQTTRSSKKSRLISGVWSHVKKSGSTIVRTYITYRPLKTFAYLSVLFFVPGFLVGLRFVWYWSQGQGGGHIQSLILASLLMSLGVQIGLIGLVADTISALRRIVEK